MSILSSSISIAVPALNEESKIAATIKSLEQALRQLPHLSFEILIINDGSHDCTKDIIDRLAAENPRIRVIHHSVNLGLGQSIKDALVIAQYKNFIIIPGDNDMPMPIIMHMLWHCNQAEMVMCYFLDTEKRSRFRNLLSSLFGLAYMLVFNIHVKYINGPCIYPTEKLKKLSLRSTRFSIVAEINVKILKGGVTFMELAGIRQNADAGSKALRLKNLWETITVFLGLIYDIFINKKDQFKQTSVRLHPDLSSLYTSK